MIGAGWTHGLDQTLEWIMAHGSGDALAMIDAPLMVTNPIGQRMCERKSGQRYGR